MLCGEIIAVYRENHTQQKCMFHTVWATAEVLMLKQVVHMVTALLKRLKCCEKCTVSTFTLTALQA